MIGLGLSHDKSIYFFQYRLYKGCPLSSYHYNVHKYSMLGPVTPLPICLTCELNNLHNILTWNWKFLAKYTNTIRQAFSLKLDHFQILNFPALFSDWSIQKISKNFLWNMKKYICSYNFWLSFNNWQFLILHFLKDLI